MLLWCGGVAVSRCASQRDGWRWSFLLLWSLVVVAVELPVGVDGGGAERRLAAQREAERDGGGENGGERKRDIL